MNHCCIKIGVSLSNGKQKGKVGSFLLIEIESGVVAGGATEVFLKYKKREGWWFWTSGGGGVRF